MRLNHNFYKLQTEQFEAINTIKRDQGFKNCLSLFQAVSVHPFLKVVVRV